MRRLRYRSSALPIPEVPRTPAPNRTSHGIERIREPKQDGARAAADQEPEQRAEDSVIAVFEHRFHARLGQVRRCGVVGIAAYDTRGQRARQRQIACGQRIGDRQIVIAQAAQADAKIEKQRMRKNPAKLVSRSFSLLSKRGSSMTCAMPG